MELKKKRQPLQRAVRIGFLLDKYGALLTEHQYEFLKLHYNEDLSFGEIAGEFNISRQAAYDTARKGELLLDEYAQKLSHLKLHQPNIENQIKEICQRLLAAEKIGQNEQLKEDILKIIELMEITDNV